jgi:hypothetical protein
MAGVKIVDPAGSALPDAICIVQAKSNPALVASTDGAVWIFQLRRESSDCFVGTDFKHGRLASGRALR